MTSKLEFYDLPTDKPGLLDRVFSQTEFPNPILEIYQKRPRPSLLRERVTRQLSFIDIQGNRHSQAVMEAVLRSIQHSWESFYEGSVSANEFTRTRSVPLTKSSSFQEKAVASQADVSAGSIALQDSPVLVLPPGDANLPIFLNLPKKALEVLLLLRNAKPDYKRFSLGDDTPVHRLFDLLHGVIDTNAFGGTGIYGKVGIMLLAGSMFNHSDTPNLTRAWDDATEKMIFVSVRDIKGEELVVAYADDISGAERVEKLKNYGLQESD